ncbi:hypothetical protein KIL84_000946, partial [Mauremys mutica]
DLFFQEKLLLNGVDENIKLTCSKDAFSLVGDANEGFKLWMISASPFCEESTGGPRHTEALLTINSK